MPALLRFQGCSSGGGERGDSSAGERLLLARIFGGFWALGLLNNAAYVIMIAGANEITSSAVGAVYFAAIAPTIIVKLTAPYWFHLAPYAVRFWVAAALMAASFVIVGLSRSTAKQLAGVALVALQGGLGEASALGLCALYPSQLSLTAWSSGTGFAGMFGYAWVAALHVWLRLSFTATLLLALLLPAAWLGVFHLVLQRAQPPAPAVAYQQLPLSAPDAAGGHAHAPPLSSSRQSSRADSPGVELSTSSMEELAPPQHQHHPPQQQQQQQQQQQRLLPVSLPRSSESQTAASPAAGKCQQQLQQPQHGNGSAAPGFCEQQQQLPAPDTASMSFGQRLAATCRLWPYMVPLFVVYFAEYAMQSGTWTAIGFPVTSAEARGRFYLFANWTYQAGVFVSRSSGMLFQASRAVLWLMPALQCLLLLLFGIDAVTHAWYGWSLLLPCFLTGLLGGAVYVNSFTLLSREVAPELREFSLSAACVADSLGIAAADLAAILIQGCLYRWQHLHGAAFACGGGGATHS